MPEDIPRRMMRFYRKKPTEEEIREKSSDIAISEVDLFRERHNRYPNRNELEEISQSVFEQLKTEIKKKETELEDIDLGTEEQEGTRAWKKNLLELRKERRQGGAGTAKSQQGEDARSEGKGMAPEKKLSRSEMRALAKKKGAGTGKPAKAGKDEAKEGMVSGPVAGGDLGEEAGTEGMDVAGLGLEGGETLEELEKLEEAKRNREGVRKLAAIDELAKLESELGGDESGEGEFDLLDKELETEAVACPKCGSRAEEIIYCPECGDAFCNHCAKKVEALTDSVKYTCGKCGAEFKKRKNR